MTQVTPDMWKWWDRLRQDMMDDRLRIRQDSSRYHAADAARYVAESMTRAVESAVMLGSAASAAGALSAAFARRPSFERLEAYRVSLLAAVREELADPEANLVFDESYSRHCVDITLRSPAAGDLNVAGSVSDEELHDAPDPNAVLSYVVMGMVDELLLLEEMLRP